MDESAKEIIFDKDGNCNFCTQFLQKHTKRVSGLNKERDNLIEKIKSESKNREYDVVVGVSGGVDSSYVLHLAVEAGLRVLAVHMDNGWNSEVASNNISNLVKRLDVDLYTHVIDWKEYRDMMESFFQANVIDIELLYDNAMTAVNYNIANKFGIKYMLSGQNSSTEGMAMPQAWNWLKIDAANIRAIHNRYGKLKQKTFPIIGVFEWIYFEYIKKIKWVPFLDYYQYNKNEALVLLQEKYGYKPYPYKHYESVFTRFYQGYILPNKFGVDKRKLHFSTLICSGQMDRIEAIKKLQTIPYPSELELKNDIEYFLKKMKWSTDQLNIYLKEPQIEHSHYSSQRYIYDVLKSIYKSMKS